MGYAQGILLAVQDMEDLRRYEKESEFEREKFEKNLTARYRSDILPFALEALKKQQALTIKEADLKRSAIAKGFTRRTANALYDRGQLQEMVDLANDANTDKRFVTILNKSLEKQLDERLKNNPEEADDKLVDGVKAGLSVSSKIDTPETELEALTFAKLTAGDVSPEDLVRYTAELQAQGTRTYIDDPLRIRTAAAEEISSTEADRLERSMKNALGPLLEDHMMVVRDSYGTYYDYNQSAPTEVRQLFTNLKNSVRQINRSQDISVEGLNAQDISNFLVQSITDTLKLAKNSEQKDAALIQLNQFLGNPANLTGLTAPTVTFEPVKTGDGNEKVVVGKPGGRAGQGASSAVNAQQEINQVGVPDLADIYDEVTR